jgi:hypothetical protein
MEKTTGLHLIAQGGTHVCFRRDTCVPPYIKWL